MNEDRSERLVINNCTIGMEGNVDGIETNFTLSFLQ